MKTSSPDVDLERVRRLKEREDARFLAEHPRSMEHLRRARSSMPLGVPVAWMKFLYDHPPMVVAEAEGASFTDLDGRSYLDFNFAITAAFCGHTPEPVIDAVSERIRRGTVFQLPTEDAIWVAEELARRFGVPFWQFTLSASQANAEVIRLARLATGREKVLVFGGKYHGHLDDTLGVLSRGEVQPEYLGISARNLDRTLIVPFNDIESVKAALLSEDVALVLAEPALTNVGIVLPDPNFHAALRELCRATGTLLAIDETQTQACAFGGLTRAWSLDPDVIVLGKSLGGGVPVAAYGMGPVLSELIDRPARAYEVVGEVVDEPAIGGTLFANALSLAACRAALEGVMTEASYKRAVELGGRLADGIDGTIRRAGLAWTTYRLFTRSGYTFAPTLPRNAADSSAADIPSVRHLARVYMVNRGIWEFGWWAGPMVSLATGEEDVDAYLGVFEEFLADLLDTPALVSA